MNQLSTARMPPAALSQRTVLVRWSPPCGDWAAGGLLTRARGVDRTAPHTGGAADPARAGPPCAIAARARQPEMPRAGPGRNARAQLLCGAPGAWLWPDRPPSALLTRAHAVSAFQPQIQPVRNADFIIPIDIDGTSRDVYVLKRPHVDEFMRRMGELFEVVVFTASLSKVRVVGEGLRRGPSQRAH